MDSTDIDKKIIDSVTEAWGQKLPVLLSALGALDNGAVARQAKAISGGLKSYLEGNLGSALRVITHSGNSVVIGVVPRNADTEDIADFDSLLDSCFTKIQDKKIRFDPRFWVGFRRTLETGMHRFIDAEGSLVFKDIVDGAVPPEGWPEVRREYVAVGPEVADSEVYRNVRSWAESQDLPLDKFSSTSSMNIKLALHPRLPKDASTLDRLLGALDPSDLKRIELPLDIIQKLRMSKL